VGMGLREACSRTPGTRAVSKKVGIRFNEQI
jgi:hypothetical protein